MAILNLSRTRYMLALALCCAACDLGLDPSMVGGGGASSSSASATGGGSSTSSNSGTTTTSASSTGGGGAGDGGAGGAAQGGGGGGGAITWEPCAAPDDFTNLDLGNSNDAWVPTGNVSVVGAGDPRVRMQASVPSPRMQQVAPSLLEACFTSMRVDNDGGAILYLSIDCAPGRMEFAIEKGQQSMVEITDPPVATPEPAPVGAPFNLDKGTLRVRFEGAGGNIVFEFRYENEPSFITLITMPQPAWADSCVVGFGAESISTSAELDDFCVDAP